MAIFAGAMLAAGLPIGPATAEPVTPDGAKTIAEAFARNLGKVWIDKGIVSVKPDGDRYDLAIALDSAKLGLPAGSLAFSLKPVIFRLMPSGTGRFAFELSSSALELTYKNSAWLVTEEGSYRLENCSGEGMLDLTAFVVLEENLHCESSAASGAVGTFRSEGRTGRLSLKMTSTITADGSVDSQISYEVVGSSETIDLKISDTLPSQLPKPEMGSRADRIRHDVTLSGLRKTGLLAAIAFASERFIGGSGTVKREEIAALAKDLLPLWRSAVLKSRYENAGWGSPLGRFEFGSFDQTTRLDGLIDKAGLDGNLIISGMKLPRGMQLDWIATQLPTKLNFGIRYRNVDLARLVDGLIEAATTLDAPAPEPFDALLRQVLTANQATMAFEVAIAGASYDVKGEGMGPAWPYLTGKASFSAAGLDAVIAALGKVTGKPQAQHAALGLTFLKGLAKTEVDGRLVWDVDYSSPAGKLTVNGQNFALGGRN